MIGKVGAYERQQACNSRFRAMADSENPWDRANSEAFRLATQAWHDIASEIGTSFDPQSHVDRLSSRWRQYCETGIAYDSIDAMAKERLAEFVADDRRRRGVKLIGLDLKLMTCEKEASIHRKGEDLIVIARISGSLHFRVFNGNSRMVVDASEATLGGKASEIKFLKVQLENLWPPHALTGPEKSSVVCCLPAIIGQAQIPEPARKPKKPVEWAKDDPRHHIDPKVMDAIIEDFRTAFDMAPLEYAT